MLSLFRCYHYIEYLQQAFVTEMNFTMEIMKKILINYILKDICDLEKFFKFDINYY